MNKQETIDAIVAECREQGIGMDEQIAYVLATVEHETGGTFAPVEEGFYLGAKAKAFQRKLRYYPYYGRGYVQITWKANYASFGKMLGLDLVGKPELALREDVALYVLVQGFKLGLFTGKCIDDYINHRKVDYLNARRCINGTDKAAHIRTLALRHLEDLR